MRFRNSYIDKILSDKLLLAICLIFILWKFFLISTLWNDRASAPEPDDSYSYIARIESFKECLPLSCDHTDLFSTGSASSAYPSYRIFLGIISKSLNLSAEKTYELGFYIGTILLLPVLVFLLKTMRVKKSVLYLSLILLTVYHGTPQTHGFYWVVPSFFSVLLFLLILKLTLDDKSKNWQILFPLIVPIFVLTHITSYYYVFIFPIFLILDTVLNKKLNKTLLKKISVLILIATLIVFLQSLYVNKHSLKNPYSIQKISKSAQESVSLKQNSSQVSEKENDTKNILKHRIENTKIVYFGWIFFHWILILPFLVIIFTLWKNKQTTIIALFFAALVFFVTSSLLNNFGFRSAIILWPLTFILYAHGIVYTKKELRDLLKKNPQARKISLFIFNFSVVIAIFCVAFYSLVLNTSMNYRRNVIVNQKIVPYLEHNIETNDTVYADRITKLMIFSLSKSTYEKINFRSMTSNPKYILVLNEKITSTGNENEKIKPKLKYIIQKFDSNITPFKKEDSPKINPSYKLKKRLGSIEIYIKK